jgi:hypothetical protein
MHKTTLLIFCIILCSCGASKKQDGTHLINIYTRLSQAQNAYNDSLTNAFPNALEAKEPVFDRARLEEIHTKRLDYLKKRNLPACVKNGYLYVMDNIHTKKGSRLINGNIWSKEFNHYYYSDFKSKETADEGTIIKTSNSGYGNEWKLFKRAIEEWDLSQIDKYQQLWDIAGSRLFIASRIKIENYEITEIKTYTWYNDKKA